jgi:hypothetical protein
VFTFDAHAQIGPKEGEIIVDGYSFFDMNEAAKKVKENSTVFIGPGIYTEGMKISHDNVSIIGKNTHFKGAVIEGKATFVVTSDNVLIESIECSEVEVPSENGACVRHEGGKLTLSNVHFHHSEQGLLQGGGVGGEIYVKYSLFEYLGKKGQAHGLYTSGALLDVKHSIFRNTKDQGHAIKSRSKVTNINNVVIDSGTGDDSRALDIPNGGELYIKDSVFYQGVNTVNGQIIGYALETLRRQRNYKIEIINTIVIGERPNGNTLLLARKNMPDLEVAIYDNVIIGRFTDEELISDKSNVRFKNRSEAGLKSSELPDSKDIFTLRLKAIQ